MDVVRKEEKAAVSERNSVRDTYVKPEVIRMDIQNAVTGFGGSATDSAGFPAGAQA